MAEVYELEELIARLPRQSVREAYEEIQAARRAALSAPPVEPSIIPHPVYPYRWPHRSAGIVLYPCALGCGWSHSEDVWAWLPGPLTFRIDPRGSIDRALTEHADARAAELRDRIETAIRGHFTAAHPGREIPTTGAA